MLWHVDNQKPYVHQPDRCELKIYAPEHILEYTIPTITTSNLAAWRFEPTLAELLRGQPRGSVLYRGVNWNVMTFQSAFFPLRAGEVTASGTVTARRHPSGGGPAHCQFQPYGNAGGNGHTGSENHRAGTAGRRPGLLHQCRGNFRISASTGCKGPQRQRTHHC